MWDKIKSFLFKNTTTKQTVAKNTFWLSVSNFGGRLIKAIIVIYGARVLGTANWGVFSYAITLAGFLALFMDPGINGILIRDASRASEEEQETIFSTMFVMKIFLLLLGIVIIVFVAPYFSTLPGAKVLLPIVAIILALDTLRDFFSSLIRAKEKMEWEAGLFLFTNLAIVVFGFIFIMIAATAKSLSWGYVVGDALGTIAMAYTLRHYFKKIFTHFDAQRVFPIMRSAWPFALSGVLGFLFTGSDVLIISWLRSASEVGIYSAVIRIIQALYIVPLVIQFSTLPLLARLAGKDNERFRNALERTLSMVFFASIPMSIGGIILGTQIMTLVFGASYVGGGLSFEILMATLLFDFAASVIINALFAYEHQKSLIISAALGGVVNVGLDLVLIPFFGIAGSAVATLVAQMVNNGYLWYAMKGVNHFTLLPHLKNIFIGGAAMGIATLLMFFLGVNVVINVVISCLVYLLVLRILREPLLIEIKRLLYPVKVS